MKEKDRACLEGHRHLLVGDAVSADARVECDSFRVLFVRKYSTVTLWDNFEAAVVHSGVIDRHP